MATALRKAAMLRPAQRRALAHLFASWGMSTKQIADRLGVSDVSVRKYLAGSAASSRYSVQGTDAARAASGQAAGRRG